MAEAIVEFNADQKLEEMKNEVIRVFDELYHYVSERRNVLLAQLDKIRENYRTNIELVHAIEELKIIQEGLKSNLLASVGKNFDERIRGLENSKVHTENLEFVRFRCYSEKIRKSINEIDLYELSPEYVGRENPVLTACSKGHKDGELFNPKGIVLDRARNEVYVCDSDNSCIQVLSTVGEYVRQFGSGYLTEPRAICLSQQDELFVTDCAKECVVKFGLAGEFLKQVGSRGNKPGQFRGITGLCCDAGLVYVCDIGLQRIQIFDSELNYCKYFGYGELDRPVDIQILSDTIYVLSQKYNYIYCYNIDCTLQKKIELTGQEQLMTALFFTIDINRNFLVTNPSLQEIRIFSPKGILKHILGTGQLPCIAGITLDNSDRIICVCSSKGCFIKF